MSPLISRKKACLAPIMSIIALVGLFWLANGALAVAPEPPLSIAAPCLNCQYHFEGTAQGWIPQPDNADGNNQIWVTPTTDYAYTGQWSLRVDFEGVKGAAGIETPSSGLQPHGVVPAYVYGVDATTADVWVQFYLLEWYNPKSDLDRKRRP